MNKKERHEINIKRQKNPNQPKKQQELNPPKDPQQELEQPEDLQQKLKNEEQQKPDAEKLQQELQNKINEIREFVGDDNYIFRGENKIYDQISSKLHRYFQIIEVQAELQKRKIALDFSSIQQPLESQLKKQLGKYALDIDFPTVEKILKENILVQLAQKNKSSLNVERVQKDLILKDIQEYVDFENEFRTLAELQHYGGSTNLIDFSHDLAVALFFACDGESDKDGRLILLSPNAEGVLPPMKNQNNRAVFQKSRFVKRDNGYIKEKVKQFIIPKNIKPLILTYVQNYFDIRTETVYGDLMGYIQNQEMHSEAYKQFFAGSFYSNEGNFAEEIKCYTNAINLKPNFAEAYNNRGSARMNLDPLASEEAIADFKDAIKLNRNFAGAYNNCGVAYGSAGEYELALDYYTKAIELNPNHADAYNNRSTIYDKNKDYDLAIADCNKAIALNPNNPQAYNNRGIACKNKGENDPAIADFNRSIALNPNHSAVYKNCGIAYSNKGENDIAITYYTKAIDMDPDYLAAYNDRGIAYDKKEEYTLAIADYTKAIALNLNDPAVYNNRGITYSKKGDDALAIADYTQAIALKPDYIEAYLNRGNSHRKKGRKDLTIDDFNKAFALNPNLVKAHITLGIAKKTLIGKDLKEHLEIALQLAEQEGNEEFIAGIRKEIADIPDDSD